MLGIYILTFGALSGLSGLWDFPATPSKDQNCPLGPVLADDEDRMRLRDDGRWVPILLASGVV